jgi:hypothetical protein
VAESFFATVETESIMEADWPTRDAARQAIFAYIETWYNRERRHPSLGYRSPVQYEREVLAQGHAAWSWVVRRAARGRSFKNSFRICPTTHDSGPSPTDDPPYVEGV